MAYRRPNSRKSPFATEPGKRHMQATCTAPAGSPPCVGAPLRRPVASFLRLDVDGIDLCGIGVQGSAVCSVS